MNILDNALALGSVPYNFTKGIIGNPSHPGAVTQVSLTQAQKEHLNEIAQAKGTPTGTIDYSDYGSPTKTFSGISGMTPLDASLATTMGGTGYTKNPDGSINYTGGAYDFNKGNVITDFIDKGGIIGAADRFGKNIYDKFNPSYEDEDEYDFSGIEGQTAGLGVASFLAEKFGPKLGAYLFKTGKNKALGKIGQKVGPAITGVLTGGGAQAAPGGYTGPVTYDYDPKQGGGGRPDKPGGFTDPGTGSYGPHKAHGGRVSYFDGGLASLWLR